MTSLSPTTSVPILNLHGTNFWSSIIQVKINILFVGLFSIFSQNLTQYTTCLAIIKGENTFLHQKITISHQFSAPNLLRSLLDWFISLLAWISFCNSSFSALLTVSALSFKTPLIGLAFDFAPKSVDFAPKISHLIQAISHQILGRFRTKFRSISHQN